jgi:hypothetical protein
LEWWAQAVGEAVGGDGGSGDTVGVRLAHGNDLAEWALAQSQAAVADTIPSGLAHYPFPINQLFSKYSKLPQFGKYKINLF